MKIVKLLKDLDNLSSIFCECSIKFNCYQMLKILMNLGKSLDGHNEELYSNCVIPENEFQ